MTDDPEKLRRRSGRPFQHEDGLRLLLHVEIGCAAFGPERQSLLREISFPGFAWPTVA